MSAKARALVAALALPFAAAAILYFAFPELIVRALVANARRGASLGWSSARIGEDHVAFLEGGSGAAVVLLHGFGNNKDSWNRVAARLTPKYHVIALDLPGFGESPARDGERYDPVSQAERVGEFLVAIGVDPAHVGGLSMGGEVAVAYAAAFPDGLRTLLIAGAPGVRAPETTQFMRDALAGKQPFAIRTEQDVDRLFALALFRPRSIPGQFKRLFVRDAIARGATNERIFADILNAGEGALEPLLPQVRARALIAWGAEDRMIHPSSVGVYAALLAGSETTVFPSCGHDLLSECSDALAERYLAFLGEAR